jgi:hypothetical protein
MVSSQTGEWILDRIIPRRTRRVGRVFESHHRTKNGVTRPKLRVETTRPVSSRRQAEDSPADASPERTGLRARADDVSIVLQADTQKSKET